MNATETCVKLMGTGPSDLVGDGLEIRVEKASDLVYAVDVSRGNRRAIYSAYGFSSPFDAVGAVLGEPDDR